MLMVQLLGTGTLWTCRDTFALVLVAQQGLSLEGTQL